MKFKDTTARPPGLFTATEKARAAAAVLTSERVEIEQDVARLRAMLEEQATRLESASKDEQQATDHFATLAKELATLESQWTKLTGGRHASGLGDCSTPVHAIAGKVLAWTPEGWKTNVEMPQYGFRLHGPVDSGADALIHELGRRLYLDGADVFPTSGAAFQAGFTDSALASRVATAGVVVIVGADGIDNPAAGRALQVTLRMRRDAGRPVLATTSASLPSHDSRADVVGSIQQYLPDAMHISPSRS